MTPAELFALRLAVGLWIAASGAQKAFGWFGGAGVSGTSEEFAHLGYPKPKLMVCCAAGAQISGGVLVASGFLLPLGCFALGTSMLSAALALRHNGFWNQQHGYEYPLFVSIVVGVLALAGAGSWSVDETLGFAGHHPAWGAGALLAASAVALTTEFARSTHRGRANQSEGSGTRRDAPAVLPTAAE
jgi:putative oxidoreductase